MCFFLDKKVSLTIKTGWLRLAEDRIISCSMHHTDTEYQNKSQIQKKNDTLAEKVIFIAEKTTRTTHRIVLMKAVSCFYLDLICLPLQLLALALPIVNYCCIYIVRTGMACFKSFFCVKTNGGVLRQCAWCLRT